MHLIAALCIAFSTYSKIPMPQVAWTDENRRYAMCFFPLIGVAVGAALWLWLGLSDLLGTGAFLRGAVAAALPILITGGIHMDGFMDTQDALSSWQSREKRLEILKDSHTGAFAVMGCALYLLLYAAILGEAPRTAGAALMCVCVLSRALSALALSTWQLARPSGMLGGFARASHLAAVIRAAWVYIALAVAGLLLCMGVRAALPLAVAAVCLGAYRRMAYRQFGGVTGDLAGWFVQVMELCCAFAVVWGGRIA